MLQRFVSATAVASIVVGIAALVVSSGTMPNPDGAYLLVRIWCVVPVVWGLWALLIPPHWVPGRFPLWGAMLGVIAGMVAGFVFDLPARVLDMPSSTGASLGVFVFAVVAYGLLWMLVRTVYLAIGGEGKAAG